MSFFSDAKKMQAAQDEKKRQAEEKKNRPLTGEEMEAIAAVFTEAAKAGFMQEISGRWVKYDVSKVLKRKHNFRYEYNLTYPVYTFGGGRNDEFSVGGQRFRLPSNPAMGMDVPDAQPINIKARSYEEVKKMFEGVAIMIGREGIACEMVENVKDLGTRHIGVKLTVPCDKDGNI